MSRSWLPAYTPSAGLREAIAHQPAATSERLAVSAGSRLRRLPRPASPPEHCNAMLKLSDFEVLPIPENLLAGMVPSRTGMDGVATLQVGITGLTVTLPRQL